MSDENTKERAGVLPEVLSAQLPRIRQLCERYRVVRLDVIGSAATGRFDATRSDLDLVVEFEAAMPRQGFRDPYFKLKHALEDLVGRNLDLIEAGAIERPEFQAEVERTRVGLYAA